MNSDENVILRDTHLVIPKSLERQLVNIAHEGHQDVVKCVNNSLEKRYGFLVLMRLLQK